MKHLNRVVLVAALAFVHLPFGVANSNDFNGAYLGIQGGPLFGATEGTWTNGTDTVTLDGVSQEGMAVGGFVGYGRVTNNLYMGAQVDWTHSNAETKATLNTNSATLTLDNVLSAAGRIGFLFTPKAMFYGKIAYSRLEWELSTTLGLADDDSENGIAYGVGMEAFLSDNLTLRSELTLANYKDVTIKQGSETVTLDPRTLLATIGIAYHF